MEYFKLQLKEKFELTLIQILHRIIKMTPTSKIYLKSNCLALILHHICRYRLKVIHNNLKFILPHLTKKQKKVIIKKCYLNITDTLLEHLKMSSLTPEEAKAHITIDKELREFLEKTDTNNQSIVAFASHFSNWEWLSLATFYTKKTICNIYKPTHNPRVNQFFKQMREHHGPKMFTAKQFSQQLKFSRNNMCIHTFIADQKPGSEQASVKVNFFNKQITCFKGPEIISKKLNLPIIYIHMKRIKRGYYKISHTLISDKPREMPDNEITQLCFNELEKEITNNPGEWLLTHKRFKSLIDYKSF